MENKLWLDISDTNTNSIFDLPDITRQMCHAWAPLAPGLLDIHFDSNFAILNKIPADEQNSIIYADLNIDKIKEFANKFQVKNLILDHCRANEYIDTLTENVNFMEEDLKTRLQKLQQLKYQLAIANMILHKINDDDIIHTLQDVENFKLLVSYMNLSTLDIKFIPYLIPHFHNVMADRNEFNNLEIYSSALYTICVKIVKEKQFSLLSDIFTIRFINVLFNKFKRNNKTVANCIHSLIHTSLGQIIQHVAPLKLMYDDYFNALKLLNKLQ